jgi:hypothetical protein
MVKTKEKTMSEQGGYMLVITVEELKMRGGEGARTRVGVTRERAE